MSFTNLISLQQYFSTELVCAEYLEKQRWEGKPECPHCGSEHHYRTKTRLKHADLRDYRDFLCKACGKKYSVLTGTIYESSKVGLRVWFAAMFLMNTCKKGISSIQLGVQLGISQRSAWFVLHRIRALAMEKEPVQLTETVALDESFIGGKNKNRHWDKKVPQSAGRSFKDKTPVLGMLQIGGPLRLRVIPDTKGTTIQPLILEHIQRGSTLYTDEWQAYSGLGRFYNHFVVDHSRKQYADGKCTTNSIESVWAVVKRSIIGIYHYVSRKHLHRYCDEFQFRFNHRKETALEKFEAIIRQCNGTRLLYKVLTG